jgi:hypothetical protein
MLSNGNGGTRRGPNLISTSINIEVRIIGTCLIIKADSQPYPEPDRQGKLIADETEHATEMDSCCYSDGIASVGMASRTIFLKPVYTCGRYIPRSHGVPKEPREPAPFLPGDMGLLSGTASAGAFPVRI